MTCQWCKNYRRRDGKAMCRCADGKVRPVPPEVRADTCGRFDARRSCTTCGHRCSSEERGERPYDEVCPKWELRILSSWGGSRRSRKDFSDNTKNNKEK